MNIEDLFLEQEELTEESKKMMSERMSVLGNDDVLKKLHKIKKVECITEILNLVEARKFEEAHSKVGLLTALIEYEMMFKNAEEAVSKLPTNSNHLSIKY